MTPRRSRFALLLAGVFFVTFGIGELAVRRWRYPTRIGYPSVLQELGDPAIRHLFVGTSRIIAAVDAEVFTRSLPVKNPPIRAVNIGQGNSTVIEHALGLRLLAERGLLSDRTVFVEAPGGLPDISTWEDEWYRTERPELLVPILHAGDLPVFWQSDHSRESKIAITGRYLVRSSRLFTFSERVRGSLLERVHRVTRGLVASIAEAGPSPALDFVKGGEVRTDDLDLRMIRELMGREGQEAAFQAAVIENWEDRVIASIARTVKAGGGHLVFLDVPASSTERLVLQTPAGRQNLERFPEVAKGWGARTFSIGVEFPDEDFPDLLHISRTSALDFTRDLARAWATSSIRNSP